MEYLILPITKNPNKKGRIGPMEWQDWHRGLVKTIKLAKKFQPSKILILSAVRITGEQSEANTYHQALNKMGVNDDQIMVVEKAHETIGQIKIAKEIATEQKQKLVVISAFLHYPRVRWLFGNYPAKHFSAFGLPRPREAVTDIILDLFFPIIDSLGLANWFQKKIDERRQKGKF